MAQRTRARPMTVRASRRGDMMTLLMSTYGRMSDLGRDAGEDGHEDQEQERQERKIGRVHCLYPFSDCAARLSRRMSSLGALPIGSVTCLRRLRSFEPVP